RMQSDVSRSGSKASKKLVPVSLECDDELLSILTLSGSDDAMLRTLQSRLSVSKDIDGFLEELQRTVDRVVHLRSCMSKDNGLGGPTPSRRLCSPLEQAPAHFYPLIVSELDAIGWHHLISMDDLLTTLVLRVVDSGSRGHMLTLKFPPSYPRAPPVCSVELPKPFELQWSSNSGLVSVLSQFEAALKTYQQLWDELDDIDRSLWVMEPENPGRAVLERRIAVAVHCSIVVTLNPLSPKSVPRVVFLGAEGIVAPFRSRYNARLQSWNVENSIRSNLVAILGQKLPSPADAGSSRADFSADCGICYQHRLHKEEKSGMRSIIPDLICDNAKCRRPYHPSCLWEWFQTQPDARTSFGTVFGACVYCGAEISVNLQQI
ncbi:MAG: hypothetical protein GY746_01660, partial [Gammaproteobacteria bacterium]|nr:hypothetical protein [Gammaproteobacteria bacterium]